MGLFKSIFGKSETVEASTNKSETFLVDFLNNAKGETIKRALVEFPINSNAIIVNGVEDYIDTWYVDDEGWSSDGLYRKLSTADYQFWLSSKDFKNIYPILKSRQELQRAAHNEKKSQVRNNYAEPFEYDPIDEDIYNCFIDSKVKNPVIKNFDVIEIKLSEICTENGGKYYKSPAKSAKFAIVFSPSGRMAKSINALRVKGYKVTSFEAMIEYLHMDTMCDVTPLLKSIKSFREELNL